MPFYVLNPDRSIFAIEEVKPHSEAYPGKSIYFSKETYLIESENNPAGVIPKDKTEDTRPVDIMDLIELLKKKGVLTEEDLEKNKYIPKE